MSEMAMSHPVTMGHVIAAASEFTGLPAEQIATPVLTEPVRTYRLCAQVAALELGIPQDAVRRGFALRNPCLRGRRAGAGVRRAAIARAHGHVVAQIVERAAAIAEAEPDLSAPPPNSPPSAAAVLVAAARETKSSVRDLVGSSRLQPWLTYRMCAAAAAGRLGISRVDMAAALNCRPNTLSLSADRRERLEAENGDLISRIAAKAVALAGTYCAEQFAMMLRGPAVTLPPVDHGRWRRTTAYGRATGSV